MIESAAQHAPGARVAQRGRALAAASSARVLALDTRAVLAGFVVVQWLAVLGLALTVRHNGWLYYQGGDQTWLYTSASELVHGHLPYATVGFGWPVLLTPIALVAGPNVSSALPAILVFNGVVLLPVGVLCMYGIGRRVAGRLFGYWCAALWIAVPFAGILYTNAGYHQKYTELNLPQGFGLTAMADFPSVVAILVAAYFAVRALEDDARLSPFACGVALGAAIGLKPANALFAGGLVLALLVARRWRAALWIAVGVAPFVLVLALWKERGLGSLPILSSGAGGHLIRRAALPGASIGGGYLNLDWGQFKVNLDQIQEHFWSLRLVEFMPIAGAVGLLRASRPLAALVAGWFAAFVIVKGTFPHAGIEDGSLLRLLLPAAPAFVLLIAAIPLLVPGLRVRSLAPARDGIRLPRRLRPAALAAAVVVLALWPLALVAAASPVRGPSAVVYQNLFLPVQADLGARARVDGKAVRLTWSAQDPGGSRVFYRVFRAPADGELACNAHGSGATRCIVQTTPVVSTRSTSAVDRPGPGRWTYRVSVASNWIDNLTFGDPFTLSPPLVVRVAG